MHPREGGAALGGPAHRDARAGDFDIKASSIEVDYAAVQARREVVDAHLSVAGSSSSIDVLEGDGTLQGDGSVRVGNDSYGAQAVILATGSVGQAIPGVEFGGRVIRTEEAWALEELPERLSVVGAGPRARRSPRRSRGLAW